MARSISREGIGFGDVDCNNPCSEELLCLRDRVQEALDSLIVHLSDLFNRKVTNVLSVGVV